MHVALQSALIVAGGALVGGAFSLTAAIIGAVVGLGLHCCAGSLRDGAHTRDDE